MTHIKSLFPKPAQLAAKNGPKMKLLTVLFLLFSSTSACSHLAPLTNISKAKKISIHFASDIKFDHDQLIICAYLDDKTTLACMTPEEYQVRLEVQLNL